MDEAVKLGQRRLREAGLRTTRQRQLILHVLAHSDGHLDATDIFERARSVDRRLSLSTVYRTLSAFKAAGVVRESHLDQEHHHYELDSRDDHFHLVCLECGHVVEVGSDAFSEAAKEVAAVHGFELAAAQVELTGTCAGCCRPQL